MAQPPPPESVISAADLWTQIVAMPRAHRIVPFPRTLPTGVSVGDIAMVVLTQDEQMSVTASTERFVRKLLKEQSALPQQGEMSEGYSTLFDLRCSMEILFRACKKAADPTKPFFPTPEAIGKLSSDEIAVLVFNYRRVQSELGPIVDKMSQDEYDAWIERLAKGGSMFPFDSLSLAQRSGLMTYMAQLCYASRTGRSSPGTQPDENT